MRRYRISNKFRFITFLTVLILLAVFASNALLGLNHVSGSDKREYVNVKVESGDTLWNLAREYGPENADRRVVVYEICRLNNVSASDLQAGQFIMIPTSL